MVSKIAIQNFKSIDKLEIELGRLNVFIGANGSGKSNLLEGIAMGVAGIGDRLEHEFLSTRIRVTAPKFMTSAFELKDNSDTIHVSFRILNSKEEPTNAHTILQYSEKTWILKDLSLEINNKQINLSDIPKLREELHDLEMEIKVKFAGFETLIASSKNNKADFGKLISTLYEREKIGAASEEIKKNITALEKTFGDFRKKTNIRYFLIFAPENYFLRNFNEESQIRPLGVRGEGLFNHIAELHEEKPELFAKINEQLRVLDWFDGFEMPNDLKFTEKRIRIKDNYLQPDLSYFDQRSANEGFLYLLFYFTLFVSDETPSFFAIDNIDNAMNPKLGRQLVKTLAQLAKQHQKQAILTTHNPAILDGLNLDDDEQRLFVVYRNADGQTRTRRIFKKKTEKNTSLPLSEMFLRGYLGGLPNNF